MRCVHILHRYFSYLGVQHFYFYFVFLSVEPTQKKPRSSRVATMRGAAVLASLRRGAVVEVAVRGVYGANNTYTMADVARICSAIDDGTSNLTGWRQRTSITTPSP